MTLRDDLAVALGDLAIPYVGSGPDAMAVLKWSEEGSDAILSDPAFRAALTKAVAEAFAQQYGWEEGYRITVGGAADALDGMAAAIVARMLGGTTGPHPGGIAQFQDEDR